MQSTARTILIQALPCLLFIGAGASAGSSDPAQPPACPENPDSTAYTSSLGGLWGTYPILSPKRRALMASRAASLDMALDSLRRVEDEMAARLAHLAGQGAGRPVLRVTCLGGLLSYPPLDANDRQALALRQEHAQLEKELAAIGPRIAEAASELMQIHDQWRHHAEYVEKRILWGFITWEERR